MKGYINIIIYVVSGFRVLGIAYNHSVQNFLSNLLVSLFCFFDFLLKDDGVDILVVVFYLIYVINLKNVNKIQ